MSQEYKEMLALYDKFVDQCSRFDRKGKTMPYTSANGYMFSFLNKDAELGIRFSKEVQQNYLEKYNTCLFKSHGATMKGYILITNAMLDETDLIVKLLNESFDHVMSLPPK